MPIVSCNLLLDEAAERAVLAIDRDLRDAGIPARGPERYRPHITLIAFELDRERVDACGDALTVLSRGSRHFPMIFEALGIFPPNGVLFLAPAPSSALLDLQRAIVERFAPPAWPPSLEQHLAPGRWTPHVTLAANLTPDTLATAVSRCASSWAPLRAEAVGIGLRVHPETIDRAQFPLVG